MNLSSFVSKSLVTVNLRASTKRAVIAEIVGYLCSRLNLPNKDLILRSVLDREEKASTGIGDGVAIPHSRLPHLGRVLFFVGVSKPGIDFGAPDGKVVHVIFLFVTPEAENRTHMKILSAIGNLQKNTLLLDKLNAVKSDSELFDILNYEPVQRESYFPLTREEVFRELETSEFGLSDYASRNRLEVYGQNRLLIVGATPLIGRFLRHLFDLSNILLGTAAVLGFVAGLDWIASAVVVAALLNAAFGFIREFKSDRAVDALRNFIPQVSKVIRGGSERKIKSENIVPGDILLLDEGDVIPADGRLIDTSALRIDNSAFSGDPKPVHKSHDPVKNQEQFLWIEVPALVFAGTTIVAGSGKAVVTSTGMDTELGRIAYLTQTIKNKPSTLQKEIGRFARLSAVSTLILLCAAALVFFLFPASLLKHVNLHTVAVAAMGIILGFSAEGLIPTITLVLFSSAAQIRRKGALIKKLSSIETLGATDVICTDKTGTLTTNEMCVKKIWLGGTVLDVGGEGYGPDGDFRKDDSSIAGVDLGNSDYRIFFYAAVLCNNASLIPPNAENSNWHISGDSTEGALLALVEKAGIDVGTIRSTYPVLRRFPFDSVRKRMSTVHDLGTNRDGGEKHYVLVKGAPRELLGLSTKALIDGKELPIDKKFEQEIDRQIDRFAQEGMRVLGFAYRRLAEKQLVEASVDQIEQGLIFTGLTAVLDPPREDVGEAVRTCRKAGVRVIMITGEYQLTALSVARKLGIVERADARVMSGKELSEITDEELRSALEAEEIVFARVNPEHRLRVVGALKNMGKSVAVTGDGISDAPVLKLADIGVAMGRRGNSVTRATAEMVLATDSFSGIVAAIGEGRILFTNLRKTVEHISSHLLPEATAFVVFLLFGGPLPLAVPLIFLIDLLIDLVPAFAVGTALSATEESMSRPVHRRDRHIVDGTTVGHNFIFRGFLVTLVAGAGFIVTSNDPGSAYPTSPFASPTVFFLAIIAAQLAFYVSRFAGVGAPRVEGFGHWATLLSAALCPMVVVVLVLYVPTLNAVFRTAPPVGHDWIVVAAVFAIIYGIAEIQGLVGRSRERSQGDPAEA